MCLFFYRYADHRDLHSFPTRRSSDLMNNVRRQSLGPPRTQCMLFDACAEFEPMERFLSERAQRFQRIFERSEEHTSELQSRLHLVCRLLLEKKKIITLSSK